MTKISGVYKITNKITGDFYIGSSKNIKERWRNHRNSANWAQQSNSKLYKDMAQYGRDNFEFEILEETTELKLKEQYWIDQLNPTYNINRAKDWNIERRRKTTKEWTKAHQEKQQVYYKEYNNNLCFYRNETLTLNALRKRFQRQGIPHPVLEAKKYLISN